jgi:hypothetical protein
MGTLEQLEAPAGAGAKLLPEHGRAFAGTMADPDGTGPSDDFVAQVLEDAGEPGGELAVGADDELSRRALRFADAIRTRRPIKPSELAPIDPTAILRESGQLRELYRLHGHDPDDALIGKLVEQCRAPIGGGATGLQASAYMANLPAEGTYYEDSDLFAQETERNDLPLEQKAFTGLGGAPIDLRISNVGVLAWIRVIFKGSLTYANGTGAVTATPQWPWNVIKRFTLNVQGQTSLVSCEGIDLRARRQRLYRHPREHVSLTTTGAGVDTATADPAGGAISAASPVSVVLVYDVPVVHDMYTLVGAIFAQSDQIYVSYRVVPAATAELFTLTGTATASLTGSLHTTITFYDVPFADVQGGRKVLVPNLSWLHGYLSGDQAFANTGEVRFPLIRTAGQLVSYMLVIFNGDAATLSPLALSELRFEYGGNRRPRQYNPPEQLVEKNVQDYNGRVKPDYAILDFEIDNPRRELVYPKGVTELQAVVGIPAGTTINPNARGHFVEETLFTGR